MNKLTCKPDKDGLTHFYLGEEDVTGIWMEFFGFLSMEDEHGCAKIFVKFYPKYMRLVAKFNKDYKTALKASGATLNH